jgi:signal transduction histidine kinase
MAAIPLPSRGGISVKSKVGGGFARLRLGHVFLDVRQRRLHCLNEAARQLHEEGVPFTAADMARQPLLAADGRVVAAVDMPLAVAWRSRETVEEGFLLPRGSGQPWQVRWGASPLLDAKGQLLGIVGSVAVTPPDIDARRLAELAHDLRTPLQSLRLLCSLLERLPQADSEVKKTVDSFRAATDRAVQIALELLHQCRGPIGKSPVEEIRWFGLEEFLAALVQEHAVNAESKGLTLALDMSATQGWELRSDPGRLARALSNLLVNAIHYTPSGRVELRTDWRTEAKGRALAISVCDTGPGISEEEQDSIFHAFERGRAGRQGDSSGSGLGLAVVDRLVEELGLTLEVYSEFGRGSAFHLLIPDLLLRPIQAEAHK